MKEKLNALKDEASLNIQKASTLQEIEDIRVKYLGKKGDFTEISKSMRDLSPEERPVFGQMVNEVKNFITTLVE
ncbi:MAG: phenylalanine--tRNA ligase subunit alpha, partial [Cetobacterium sp.]